MFNLFLETVMATKAGNADARYSLILKTDERYWSLSNPLSEATVAVKNAKKVIPWYRQRKLKSAMAYEAGWKCNFAGTPVPKLRQTRIECDRNLASPGKIVTPSYRNANCTSFGDQYKHMLQHSSNLGV
jgi:hypothetical protein